MGGDPLRDDPPEQTLAVMQNVPPQKQFLEHNNVHMNNNDLTHHNNTANVYGNAVHVLYNHAFPALK